MTAANSPTVSGLPAEKLMAAALGSTPVSSPAFAWTPPAVEEVAPWFPDYEIRSLAGRGAMGAVYRAVQRKLERPVAIKLLPAELATRDGVAARFEREARALAQLNHPGIVALHDFGRTEGGHLFIVMEYVDGTDLSRLLHAEGGALGVPQALEIVSQVCDALQYAHNHGFVHRDIKPGNVLVDREGRVKIADFGLAKFVTGPGDAPRESLHGRVTFTGLAVGTPDYTAPEQLRGGPVDHRADIYSLGVMFYEMLTGDLPRGAWTPPSQRTAAPVRLDEVVNRALQSEPDRRYQQASEVKAAMAGVPEKRARTFTAGIVWLPLVMLTAGIVLLSLNRQSVIPGVLLIMLAAVIWLYQQPLRRWMAGAVVGGLALWPFLKNGSLDRPSVTLISVCMVLVPFAVLAAFHRTRRAARAFVTAIAAFILAGGLTTLGLSNHPKVTVSTGQPAEATTGALTKIGEAAGYYGKQPETTSRDLAGNSAAISEFAKAKAAVLTDSVRKFIQARGEAEAVSAWSGKSLEERYQLVKGYVAYGPSSLVDFAPAGYRFLFPNDIRAAVRVEELDRPGLEAISSRREGRLLKLEVGVGQQVVAGTLVATMDTAPLKMALEALKDDVLERWEKEIAAIRRDMMTLDAEQRQAQTAEAEDAAIIKLLETQQANSAAVSPNVPETLRQVIANDPDKVRANLELAKAKARSSQRPGQLSQMLESHARLQTKVQDTVKSATALKNTDLADEKIVSLLPLNSEERQRRRTLQQALADCELKTEVAGIVQNILKTPGEHCAAGETVVTVSVNGQAK